MMSTPTATHRTPSTAPVALLLLGSGFCALVYQVAWLRQLRLVFGASTASSAAVLAIFMGGLGLGGLVLGRRADTRRSPLAFYGRLELGIALLAALSPWLILAVREVYVALGGTARLGPFFGTIVRLALAAAVLGVPTFLMGGTLPAVARAVERASDASRRSLALLYGVNTLGAVTGALVTTFFFLEWWGIRKSIWTAAALNLVVALLALVLARESSSDNEERVGTEAYPYNDGPSDSDVGAGPRACPPSSGSPPPLGEGPGVRAPAGVVLSAAAIVGFAFLLMELVWYRMLAPLLGGSSYTFGLILAVALLGIGLGGLVYSLGKRERRPSLHAFAASCSLEALFLIVPFALGDRIATLALLLRPLAEAGFVALAAAWTLIAAIVVLPAAIVSGYQFPQLVAVLGAGERDVGRQVGLTYAWNTAGAIAGSIAGGFGLLPLLSAPGVWRAVVVMLVLLAGVSLVLGWRTRTSRLGILVPVAASALALVLTTSEGPTAFWRHSPIGAGRLPSTFDGPNELRALVAEQRRSIVWEVEGVESSVALEGQAQYVFLLGGKADGSALRDAPNMVMSVLVGAALHAAPERALVIGLGSGLSAGWLAEVPSIERVDVVELEPAVAHVAEVCSSVNHDVLRHPKVDLVIGDGRELLLTSEETYDVIFSQPSNPYRAGIASLFSQEFYQAVERRLRPGGVLLQWLQGYEVDGRVISMAYATLGTVFPSVETWQVHENDLLLVATREPLVHDLGRIRARVAEEPWKGALEKVWGVSGPEGFYSGYLASAELASEIAAAQRGSVNTDDHPRIEFGFVRSLGRRGLFDVADLSALARSRGQDRPAIVGGEVDWTLVAELGAARSVTWGGRPRWTLPRPDDEIRRRLEARRAYRSGDLARAGRLWQSQSGAPRAPVDQLLLAEVLAELGDPRAPEEIERLGSLRPLEARAATARWSARTGDVEGAVHELVVLFEACRQDPWIYPSVLARSLDLARDLAERDPRRGEELFAALAEPFAVLLVEELRWRRRFEIARVLGSAERCAEALAPFEPHVPWEGRFLLRRFQCYQRAGHPLASAAGEDVGTFLDQAPPRLDSGLIQEGGGS